MAVKARHLVRVDYAGVQRNSLQANERLEW